LESQIKKETIREVTFDSLKGFSPNLLTNCPKA